MKRSKLRRKGGVARTFRPPSGGRRSKETAGNSTSTADEEAQDAWEYRDTQLLLHRRRGSSSPLPEEEERRRRSHFETAVHNQYTPEVQHIARLISSQGYERRFLDQLRSKQCEVQSNGKVNQLICICDLPRNQPIIECKGKYLLASQFHEMHPLYNKRLYPFVLFYNMCQEEICVDASFYGNDARFVRRSCRPNAEIRFMSYNGNLHLYLASTKVIFKDDEVTLPMASNEPQDVECACENEECTFKPQQKKVNGDVVEALQEKKKRTRRTTIAADDDTTSSLTSVPQQLPENTLRTERVLKHQQERVKGPSERQRALSERSRERLKEKMVKTIPKAPAKVKERAKSISTERVKPVIAEKVKSVTTERVKSITTERVKSIPTERVKVPSERIRAASERVKASVERKQSQERFKMEKLKTPEKVPKTPEKTKASPVKMEPFDHHQVKSEPVATDSFDLKTSDQETEDHSSDHKKKLTREERKMDAIMRAFEQLEKMEKRRQQAIEKHKTSHPTKSSLSETPVKSEPISEDPKIEEIKQEEEKPEVKSPIEDKEEEQKPLPLPVAKPKKGGKRRRGSGTPNRRRTRTNSGGSDVDQAEETPHLTPTPQSPPVNSNTSTSNAPPHSTEQPSHPSPSGEPSPAATTSTSPVVLKTKRFLLHEWLQEKSETSPGSPSPRAIHTEMKWNTEAAAATYYVRCTKDSPHSGISAAHLRRSNSSGQIKAPPGGQGSAKKRWLRQAMFDIPDDQLAVESMAVEALENGCLSPNSHADTDSPGPMVEDVLTPLKKRRLMRESVESMSSPHSAEDVSDGAMSNSLAALVDSHLPPLANNGNPEDEEEEMLCSSSRSSLGPVASANDHQEEMLCSLSSGSVEQNGHNHCSASANNQEEKMVYSMSLRLVEENGYNHHSSLANDQEEEMLCSPSSGIIKENGHNHHSPSTNDREEEVLCSISSRLVEENGNNHCSTSADDSQEEMLCSKKEGLVDENGHNHCRSLASDQEEDMLVSKREENCAVAVELEKEEENSSEVKFNSAVRVKDMLEEEKLDQVSQNSTYNSDTSKECSSMEDSSMDEHSLEKAITFDTYKDDSVELNKVVRVTDTVSPIEMSSTHESTRGEDKSPDEMSYSLDSVAEEDTSLCRDSSLPEKNPIANTESKSETAVKNPLETFEENAVHEDSSMFDVDSPEKKPTNQNLLCFSAEALLPSLHKDNSSKSPNDENQVTNLPNTEQKIKKQSRWDLEYRPPPKNSPLKKTLAESSNWVTVTITADFLTKKCLVSDSSNKDCVLINDSDIELRHQNVKSSESKPVSIDSPMKDIESKSPGIHCSEEKTLLNPDSADSHMKKIELINDVPMENTGAELSKIGSLISDVQSASINEDCPTECNESKCTGNVLQLDSTHDESNSLVNDMGVTDSPIKVIELTDSKADSSMEVIELTDNKTDLSFRVIESTDNKIDSPAEQIESADNKIDSPAEQIESADNSVDSLMEEECQTVGITKPNELTPDSTDGLRNKSETNTCSSVEDAESNQDSQENTSGPKTPESAQDSEFSSISCESDSQSGLNANRSPCPRANTNANANTNSNSVNVVADSLVSASGPVSAQSSGIDHCTKKTEAQNSQDEKPSPMKSPASATQKRKVSLSEYRLRMRENASKTSPTVTPEKAPKRNSLTPPSMAAMIAETSLEQLTLAPLPLFDKHIGSRLSSQAKTTSPLKTTLSGSKESDETSNSVAAAEHRENLTERLKREFGFDLSEGPALQKGLPPTQSKPRTSPAAPLPPPPPPPPRPRLPSQTQFAGYYTQQQPRFIVPQGPVAPPPYMGIQPPPMAPNLHPGPQVTIDPRSMPRPPLVPQASHSYGPPVPIMPSTVNAQRYTAPPMVNQQPYPPRVYPSGMYK